MPTILRSLTTRVLPFLSPPTVFTTVVGGFSFSFFSICLITKTFNTMSLPIYARFCGKRNSGCVHLIQQSALTLVSGALFFLLYMARRENMTDREKRPIPRASTGLRLQCRLLATFFLSPSAI